MSGFEVQCKASKQSFIMPIFYNSRESENICIIISEIEQ